MHEPINEIIATIIEIILNLFYIYSAKAIACKLIIGWRYMKIKVITDNQ